MTSTARPMSLEVGLALASKVALFSESEKKVEAVTTLKELLQTHSGVTEVEGKKGRGKKPVFWEPEAEHMPMWTAYNEPGAANMSLVYVLQKEGKKFMLGGAKLILSRHVKIPKSVTELPLIAGDDGSDEEAEDEEAPEASGKATPADVS